MKAIIIREPGIVESVEIPDPVVSDESILIKVSALGLCGSDLTTYRGLNPMVSYPRIPGHEIAGTIVAAGKSVPDRYATGLQVTVVPYTACGTCTACIHGRVNCCRYNQTLGVQRDGAATEYIAIPWQKVIPAESLSREQTVLIEPLSVGYHATERGRVKQEDTVLVFGCGMIGLGAVAAATEKGARVIAVDIADDKLEKARMLGASHIVNTSHQSIHEALEELTGGNGADVVIEAIGLAETFVDAVECACFGGRVVYIGYAKNPVTFDTKVFVSKELDILGSRNARHEDFQAVITFLSRGMFDAKTVITKQFELDACGEALAIWDRNPATVTKLILTDTQ